MVIGDGVKEVWELPRFPSGITFGSIGGTINENMELERAFNKKLDVSQGFENADKVAVVGEDGFIIFVTPLWPTFAEMESAIAAGSTGLFNTDEDWEADNLAALQSWVDGGAAYDPINDRDVKNFDVYMVNDPEGEQYYFDSGAWIPFGVEMKNYFTKTEADARFGLKTEVAEKVSIAQGAGNANKLVVTDASGNVTLTNIFDGGTL